MKLLENAYGSILKTSFLVLNPLKRAVIKTQCKVHKFINIQALKILKQDGHIKAYEFFGTYIMDINDGAVWADQDFKSSGHFYNPYIKRGMYGAGNAMKLGIGYYKKALELWELAEPEKSLFYLGAAMHIIQDMTIPQHANIKLLDNHRQYENFVKRIYEYTEALKAEKGTYCLDSIEEYIRFNARIAMKIHKKFKMIPNAELRYFRTAKCSLPLAQRTTAGCMLTFYRDIVKLQKKKLH
ncbi:MAG: zinc dependent phospholipase C family protein [Thermotaleaceae bacterium]